MSAYTVTTFFPQNEDGTLETLKRISAQNCNRVVVTSLASAARTTTTSGANIDIETAKGAIFFLNVTAASGTGGLHIAVGTVFPDNNTQTLIYTPVAITTVGRHYVIVYPGGGIFGTTTGRTSIAEYSARIPPRIRPSIQPDDASSYTYSLDYQLLP